MKSIDMHVLRFITYKYFHEYIYGNVVDRVYHSVRLGWRGHPVEHVVLPAILWQVRNCIWDNTSG